MSKYSPKCKGIVRYSCSAKIDEGWRKNEEVKSLVCSKLVAKLT